MTSVGGIVRADMSDGRRVGGAAGRVMGKLLRSPGGLFGIAAIAGLSIVAAGAPVFAPHDPLRMGLEVPLAPSSPEHLLGTDQFGRDVLTRIMYGAQISLVVAVLGGLGSLVAGVPLGVLAAVRRGKADTAISGFFDVILAFPAVFVGLVLVALLGNGLQNVVLAVAVINVPTVGRIARTAVETQLGREYIEAARATGATGVDIATRHLLPNIAPPLLVQTTVTMADAVLLEAAFGFLGLGTRPPTPSWGAMLEEGRAFLSLAPWLGIFPGLVISGLVLALNAFGDALEAALDPRRL